MTSTLERREAPDLSGAYPTVAWRVREWSLKLPGPQEVQQDEEVIKAYLGEELSAG
jgi:hypothetical protein